MAIREQDLHPDLAQALGVPNVRTPLSPAAVFGWLAFAVVLATWGWDFALLLPLKLFVVFVHECGHAFACLLTGGTPASIKVNIDESGLAQSLGGFFPLVAAGGYVGTAALGSLLVALVRYPRAQRLAVLLACFVMALLGWRAMHLWQWEFWGAMAFVIGWALCTVRYPRGSLHLTVFVGAFLCVYSVHDFGDFAAAAGQTDAGILARSWGMELLTWPIALTWMAMDVALLVAGLWAAFRPEGAPLVPFRRKR